MKKLSAENDELKLKISNFESQARSSMTSDADQKMLSMEHSKLKKEINAIELEYAAYKSKKSRTDDIKNKKIIELESQQQKLKNYSKKVYNEANLQVNNWIDHFGLNNDALLKVAQWLNRMGQIMMKAMFDGCKDKIRAKVEGKETDAFKKYIQFQSDQNDIRGRCLNKIRNGKKDVIRFLFKRLLGPKYTAPDHQITVMECLLENWFYYILVHIEVYSMMIKCANSDNKILLTSCHHLFNENKFFDEKYYLKLMNLKKWQSSQAPNHAKAAENKKIYGIEAEWLNQKCFSRKNILDHIETSFDYYKEKEFIKDYMNVNMLDGEVYFKRKLYFESAKDIPERFGEWRFCFEKDMVMYGEIIL